MDADEPRSMRSNHSQIFQPRCGSLQQGEQLLLPSDESGKARFARTEEETCFFARNPSRMRLIASAALLSGVNLQAKRSISRYSRRTGNVAGETDKLHQVQYCTVISQGGVASPKDMLHGGRGSRNNRPLKRSLPCAAPRA